MEFFLFQVAQIYQSIDFSRLASLVPFVDAFQLERSIVDAARHCDLQVRYLEELFLFPCYFVVVGHISYSYSIA